MEEEIKESVEVFVSFNDGKISLDEEAYLDRVEMFRRGEVDAMRAYFIKLRAISGVAKIDLLFASSVDFPNEYKGEGFTGKIRDIVSASANAKPHHNDVEIKWEAGNSHSWLIYYKGEFDDSFAHFEQALNTHDEMIAWLRGER